APKPVVAVRGSVRGRAAGRGARPADRLVAAPCEFGSVVARAGKCAPHEWRSRGAASLLRASPARAESDGWRRSVVVDGRAAGVRVASPLDSCLFGLLVIPAPTSARRQYASVGRWP